MTTSVPARPPITPQLAVTGIVAVLRAEREEHLPAVTQTLADAGIRCLELTMTTRGGRAEPSSSRRVIRAAAV